MASDELSKITYLTRQESGLRAIPNPSLSALRASTAGAVDAED
jgi:hypothetical protein